ncbi:MAG: hypothetical protein KatS3mg087_2153 [Patescibacteria group bacterium]|nr:MAG: hypothetical protein KatS3mg087_2153 [Patescibacteria group bacterium]
MKITFSSGPLSAYAKKIYKKILSGDEHGVVQEWSYQNQNRFWLLGGATGAFAIIVFFYYHQPATLLASNLFILGTLASIALGYSFAQLHAGVGATVIVIGFLIIIALVIPWLPGSYLLLLAPPLLSLLLSSAIFKICITTMTITVILNLGTKAHWELTASNTYLLLLLIGLVCAIGLLTEYYHRTILHSLYNQYSAALKDLEKARDHRQALNQANRDLAEAYVQLQRMNKLYHASLLEAEMSRRAKEDFVSSVSHELRTPLNMIIGFSEMILNAPATYGVLPATLLSDMGVIHRNSRHLLQLINDVLDLSQIETGHMSLSRSMINVTEIVQEAVEAVMPLFQKKSLTLNIYINDPQLYVFCDKLRIRQILLNLLSNAGRYTETGGVQVCVTTSPGEVIFSVQDSGPGIAPQDLAYIFEPFRRGAYLKHTNEGYGLGLSISKKLVEAHNGRMWVESVVGQGTSFFFTLPLQNNESINFSVYRWVNDYSQHEISIERRKLPEMTPAKERILLVTKEDDLHRHFEKFFENMDVVAVENIEDIMNMIETIRPSVLLINEVHVMDNPNFIRSRLPDLPSRLPVISCYLPGKRESCDYLHVVDYLVKPITREHLLDTIKLHLCNHLHNEVSGKTLLLVEDDLEMARLLRRQLMSASKGYRILHASTGQAALELMHLRRPELVLLDLGLPDIDGYALLTQKNNDPEIKHIPVIIISARDPFGEPIVADRLRVELRSGLSMRDIARCVQAISETLSPLQKSKN